jgi:hypothetical protein
MSWLFSQALVAEYSQATCWAGAPSSQLNVMPTQHKFWRNDKTMEPCDLSRFGLTCAVLTDDHGEAVLTWCLEASRARTSALPAKAQALTENAAECGPTWRGSLARFDHASRSWRTAQQSLLGDSDECSVTWPRSGMTAAGQCWELPTLAPPTRETGSGVWVGTPTTGDALGSTGRSERFRTKTPTPLEFVNMWPTPTVCGNYNRKGASATSGDGLATAVLKCATPTARDWRSGKASEATMERNSQPLSEQIGGKLNPTWVEWLMGWSIGWTDLKPWATDRCQPAPQQRGECLQEAEA